MFEQGDNIREKYILLYEINDKEENIMKIKNLFQTTLEVCGGIYIVEKVVKEVKDYQKTHEGTKRILAGGVWEDDDNNIYNCYGEKVGKVTWEDGFK